MKNNDLHNTISALSLPATLTPAVQARLKRDVLSYDARQRSVSKRLRVALQNLKGVSMSHKKTFFGASSLAVAAVVVLGLAGYNYQHSPRAQAEQLVNHGLFQIAQFSAVEFGSIQEKFGSDPSEALKEAKEAKDLKVITKEEFEAESSKAGSVISASLSSDPSAPSTMSFKGSDGGQGGAASGGKFTTQAVPVGAGANAPSGAPTNVMNGSFVPAPGSAEGGTAAIPVMMINSGTAVAGTSGEAGGGASSVNVSSGTVSFNTAIPSGENNPPTGPDGKPLPLLANFNTTPPTSYLRYTDSKGQIVVLSLDKDGLPMFKTIFLSKS